AIGCRVEFTQCGFGPSREKCARPPLWGRVRVGGHDVLITPTLALPHPGGGKGVATSRLLTLGELHVAATWDVRKRESRKHERRKWRKRKARNHRRFPLRVFSFVLS